MIELILSGLLIATNAMWAYLTIRLMDRLMSRNYVEYQQGKVIGKPMKTEPETTTMVEDPIDVHQAQEMNALIGIV